MKKCIFLFFSFLLLSLTTSFGQDKKVALRFHNVEVNCATDELTVDVQGRSLESIPIQTAAWTIRFTRNEDMLTNPRIVQPDAYYTVTEQLAYTGDTIISLGIFAITLTKTLPSAPGAWETLMTVKFDIIDYQDINPDCIDLVFQEDTDVIPSVATEYIAWNYQPLLNLDGYENNFTCIEDEVPCTIASEPTEPPAIIIEEKSEEDCYLLVTTKPAYDDTQWILNGEYHEKGASFKYKAPKSGKYQVCAIVGKEKKICEYVAFSECPKEGKERNSVITSQRKFDKDYLIFPNPANNYFTVSIAQNTELIAVRIFNSTGQLLKNHNFGKGRNSQQLSIPNDWNSGIYFVEIENEKKQVFRDKLVIQK